ncbi:MAG: AtzE family amidohydrolase [Pseudomonadota bacterium]
MTKTASEFAAAFQSGEATATSIVEKTLERVGAYNAKLGAFTDVIKERALKCASEIDEKHAAGAVLGPLAGVPFAVKNLFDLEGLPTRAGSKINRDHPPAKEDATLVKRLEAAGAICVGALNMGEYAYDFTGENIQDGPSRNPHNLDHMTGGSSGGSGSAVAAGLVPIALGSDTNGSIRVPASFCGVFGLKPTYGGLSRAGTFPLSSSLDHVGPLARSTWDLAASFDAMQGHDPKDPISPERPVVKTSQALPRGIDNLRISIAGGFFREMQLLDASTAVETVAGALGADTEVEVQDTKAARGAAYLITMAEGAALHYERLKTRGDDFDVAVRERLIAGAMLPAWWVQRAQKLRRIYRDRFLALFEKTDLIIAPSTPCVAPRIGQKEMELDGETMPVRPNMGLFTQPISFIGFPVVSVPIWPNESSLPIGVQLIAAPWREDIALRASAYLEAEGVAQAPVAAGFAAQ